MEMNITYTLENTARYFESVNTLIDPTNRVTVMEAGWYYISGELLFLDAGTEIPTTDFVGSNNEKLNEAE